jgi:hypothetical protein
MGQHYPAPLRLVGHALDGTVTPLDREAQRGRERLEPPAPGRYLASYSPESRRG